MNRTLAACLWAASVCLAPAARGGILFERSLVVDRSVNIFTTSQFDLEFVLGDAFFTPSNPVKLFDGVSLTPANVGDVYTADITNVPTFQSVANRLTDGDDQFIRLVLEESASGRKEQRGWRESGFFLGYGSTVSPDLAGATVEGVQLRIDQFTLMPNSPAALLPVGPQVEVLMTFTVLGTAVPEPSTLALGAVGLAMLARSVYTRRR
ncbi:MAG: PEP-CTERM sorting domain-containing protein [Planctomycetes bacterium]|nr:PEP-CTERM sorting domain-containing protein [Planctomycetota bacterium]